MPRVTEADLRPGDVLLVPLGIGAYGILYPIVRLLIKWGHVGMVFDRTKRGLTLLIESRGNGVVIRNLYRYLGRTLRVMRPVSNGELGVRVAKAAERLADSPYGYLDIPRYVLPKLFLTKLARWLPKRWKLGRWLLAHTYHHNSIYICSELVATAFRNAGYPLLDGETIPLPDDLARSNGLVLVGEMEVGRCLDKAQ